jgi:hypothetical protein
LEGQEKIIGKLSGYRLSLYDCYWKFEENNVASIYPLDLLDMIDDEVVKLTCLFGNPFSIKRKYRRKLKNILDNDPPNILLLKRVEVLAKYRGRKFGEDLISNSIYMMGRKNDLVVLRPFPLQLEYDNKLEKTEWQKELGLDNFTKEEEVAKKTLENYYKRLGFKELTDNGLMFLTLTSSRL